MRHRALFPFLLVFFVSSCAEEPDLISSSAKFDRHLIPLIERFDKSNSNSITQLQTAWSELSTFRDSYNDSSWKQGFESIDKIMLQLEKQLPPKEKEHLFEQIRQRLFTLRQEKNTHYQADNIYALCQKIIHTEESFRDRTENQAPDLDVLVSYWQRVHEQSFDPQRYHFDEYRLLKYQDLITRLEQQFLLFQAHVKQNDLQQQIWSLSMLEDDCQRVYRLFGDF